METRLLTKAARLVRRVLGRLPLAGPIRRMRRGVTAFSNGRHAIGDFISSGYIELVMRFLGQIAPVLRPILGSRGRKRVLYVGQMYYNAWYLSRALRLTGWKADVLNWNDVPSDQIFFHGEDFKFSGRDMPALRRQFHFYLRSLFNYDVFHFSNAHAMHYGPTLHEFVKGFGQPYDEVRLLRTLGKRIVYSNNSCNDGVSLTSFRSWASPPVCEICRWNNVPSICSDEINLAWGRVRNELADFQCTLGGNRKDFNDDPRVHEVPEFYCLDPEVWHPALEVPDKFKLEFSPGTVRLYHAVGNFNLRTTEGSVNIKSTHIYLPLVERLKAEGRNVDLMFFSSVPNKDLRYYQVQADIFLDMLTFGWFGANAREAMMLGKPVICNLRPAWLESMKLQIPEYVAELPIVNATPETIHDVLTDLVLNRERREDIGRRGREFALKWHSSAAGAKRLGAVYEALLARP